MQWVLHVLLVNIAAHAAVADILTDALSAFVDVNGAVDNTKTILQLVDEMKENKTTVRFDNTFPLSAQELGLLFHLYDKCGTSDSQALLTWCTGVAPNGTSLDGAQLCPPGVRTHPCTGRVLDVDKDAEHVQYLWPWQGIKCDAFTDPTTITNIYLPGQGLKCRLQDLDFSYMVSLEQLDLSQNEIHGPFPSWLGNMTMLRLLNLRENRIASNLPLSFGDNIAIEVIDLAHNQLTAPSLSFFKIFKRLRYLDLAANRFKLSLPSGFFSGEYLEYLNLSHNAFHGLLPPLPTLKHLVSFDVSYNEFEGELPRGLGSWGRSDPNDPTEDPITEFLDFSHNRFNGSIPPLLNQSSLERFAVQHNQLGGIVPQLPRSLLSRQTPQYFEENDFLCPLPQLTPTLGEFGNLTCVCRNPQRGSRRVDAKHKPIFDRIPAGRASTECTVCSHGSYANATTDYRCVQCPLGHIPNRTERVSINDSATECVACRPGTFANVTGSETCSKCPPGTIAPSSGQATCTKCLPGDFIDEEGGTACTPCPVGSAAGRAGSAKCSPCQPGTYSAYEGEFACLPCPRGHFQDQEGATVCRPCPLGHVAPRIGHKLCIPCPVGTYFDSTIRVCIKCPPNTFADQAAQTQCQACGEDTAADGFGNSRCERRAARGFGRRRPDDLLGIANASKTVEEACKPGYFNDGSAAVCQPCPIGTFARTPQTVKCEKCGLGSYSGAPASTECTLAPVGMFVGEVGAWRPRRCPPGHFADVEGSAQCRPCPENTSSVFGGRPLCDPLVDGEVLQDVSWPQVELSLIGIHVADLQSNQTLQEELREAWRQAQTANGVSRVEPHVLDIMIDGDSPASGRVLVHVVLANLPPPPRRTPRATGMLADLQETIENATASVAATQQSASEWFKQLTGKSTAPTDLTRLPEANISDVVLSPAFRTAFARQLVHTPSERLRVAASLLLVRLSPASPFRSTRAIRCPRGSFFTFLDAERRCVPCPAGSFAASEGQREACTPCPVRHFSASAGHEICDVCPWGHGAPRGATACAKCAFFSRACGDFWNNVVLTLLVGGAAVWTAWRRGREAWGTPRPQHQLAVHSAALVASVRTCGRVGRRR